MFVGNSRLPAILTNILTIIKASFSSTRNVNPAISRNRSEILESESAGQTENSLIKLFMVQVS